MPFWLSQNPEGTLGSGIGYSCSQIPLRSGAEMLAEAVLAWSLNARAPQGAASVGLTPWGPLGPPICSAPTEHAWHARHLAKDQKNSGI